MSAANSLIVDIVLPAERRNLSCAGTCTERGKPIGLPVVTATRESEPQGELTGLWVEDGGESGERNVRGLPVIGRIGVEPGGCTVSAAEGVHYPHAKAGRLPTQVARHQKA